MARSQTQNAVAAENSRKFRSEFRQKSHQISRAALCCGQLTNRGRSALTAAARQERNLARSRAISIAKFRGRDFFFENFGQNFAENRTESHVPQHADARHSVLETSEARGQAAARGEERISARSRTQNVVAAENF